MRRRGREPRRRGQRVRCDLTPLRLVRSALRPAPCGGGPDRPAVRRGGRVLRDVEGWPGKSMRRRMDKKGGRESTGMYMALTVVDECG